MRRKLLIHITYYVQGKELSKRMKLRRVHWLMELIFLLLLSNYRIVTIILAVEMGSQGRTFGPKESLIIREVKEVKTSRKLNRSCISRIYATHNSDDSSM